MKPHFLPQREDTEFTEEDKSPTPLLQEEAADPTPFPWKGGRATHWGDSLCSL